MGVSWITGGPPRRAGLPVARHGWINGVAEIEQESVRRKPRHRVGVEVFSAAGVALIVAAGCAAPDYSRRPDTAPVVADMDTGPPVTDSSSAQRLNRLPPGAGPSKVKRGIRPLQRPTGGQLAVAPSPVSRIKPIQPLLFEVPCARIKASINDGTVDLRGYARAGSDLSRLHHALLSIPGIRQVSNFTHQINDTLCPPIDFFASYLSTNHGSTGGPSIRAHTEDGRYVEGEPLIFNITAPDYKSYIYVDYFTLDGGVVHLLPQAGVPIDTVPANLSQTLGGPGSTKQWVIGPPFGIEILMVLASPMPIFWSMRDEIEPQGEYLPALQHNLKQIIDGLGRGQITADFVFITTNPTQ